MLLSVYIIIASVLIHIDCLFLHIDCSKPMEKTYNSAEVEAGWYDWWVQQGFFTPSRNVSTVSCSGCSEWKSFIPSAVWSSDGVLKVRDPPLVVGTTHPTPSHHVNRSPWTCVVSHSKEVFILLLMKVIRFVMMDSLSRSFLFLSSNLQVCAVSCVWSKH